MGTGFGKIKKEKNTLEGGKQIKPMATVCILLKKVIIKVYHLNLIKVNLIRLKSMVTEFKTFIMEIPTKVIIFMVNPTATVSIYGIMEQFIRETFMMD